MSILINKDGLQKGWGRLFVMHKDRRVAAINENGKAIIYFRSFMPYNLYFEEGDDLDTRVNNLNNFYYWCSSRVLTLDRKYAKEIMGSIGASQANTDRDRAAIAVSYRGLSLTDVYWIRAAGDNVTFSEISLFSHSLSDAFADISLRGRQITAQNAELIDARDAAGDIGTSGVAPKAWIREKGAFYLLKDGDRRDVEAELLASKIVGCFRVGHVEYSPSVFEGTAVSKCKIVTSEDRSIVPFEFINVYCVNREIDPYRFILKRDAYSYYMMNIVDYLIGNTDRHWGNWGVLIDNGTNKAISLCPLMDFNKAFTSYDTEDGAKCQTTPGNMTQKAAALEAVKKVGLNMIAEIDPKWFAGDKDRETMFFRRLNTLRSAEK